MTPLRHYRYVGPEAIRQRAGSEGRIIATLPDLLAWLHAGGELAATFVIDTGGALRLAHRRSEHVACAGGADVLTAGEMFFQREAGEVEVVEVSNQSTGYCPEAESWPAIARTLDRIGVVHPGRFTLAVVFRRCESCGQRNLVKEGWFVCGHCGAALPREWNFGRVEGTGSSIEGE